MLGNSGSVDNSNSYRFKIETDRIRKLLKRVFALDFVFLNMETTLEDKIHSIQSSKVVFEDLGGNPLVLSQIVNLNDCIINNAVICAKTVDHKSVFNFKSIIPWSLSDFTKYYLKNVLRSEYLTNNFACILDGRYRIQGFASSLKSDKIFALSVEPQTKCILKTVNRLRISEVITEPRFKDISKTVDATYKFDHGEISVIWDNCYNVFDWPDGAAPCLVTIQMDTNNAESPLYSIKTELEQLKIICEAVDNDSSQWEVYGKSAISDLDIFKQRLILILQNKGIHNRNSTPSSFTAEGRETDISEDLWSLYKLVGKKSVLKNSNSVLMSVLQENVALIKLDPTNETHFYKMLSERLLKSPNKPLLSLTNLDFIAEVGLYKLTRDFIHIISNEGLNLTIDELSALHNRCYSIGVLAEGVASLHELYLCLSYIEILKGILVESEYVQQATLVIKELLAAQANKFIFPLEQAFSTKVRHLNPKLMALSTLRIINCKSDNPEPVHRAVVFEVEYHEEEIEIYRHDMTLTEMRLFR